MKKWIFGCNPNNFDALGAFAEYDFVNWGTNCNIEENDEVYIYISAPIKKLLLKTKVEIVDVPEEELIDDSKYHEEDFDNIKEKKKYIKLKLDKCFLTEKRNYLTFEKLMDNGLNGVIRGQLCLSNNKKLMDYIEMIEA